MGEYRPGDNKERLALAGVCQAKKLHHTATDLYAAAFGADPGLADDLQAHPRYNAACCAALAAAGQGEDAAKLDPVQRLALRRQALTWLRADLATWSRLLAAGEGGGRLTGVLRHWQQ